MKGFLIKRGYEEDLIDSQVGRMFNFDRPSVLKDGKKRGLEKNDVHRTVLILDLHPVHLQGFMGPRDLEVLTDISPILKRYC